MVLNIEGYKKWVRKCRKQATYRHNLQILCQGSEDNPLHTDAFNELIENLKDFERSVSSTLSMDENSDRDH
jgi:hypothetical protein